MAEEVDEADVLDFINIGGLAGIVERDDGQETRKCMKRLKINPPPPLVPLVRYCCRYRLIAMLKSAKLKYRAGHGPCKR